MIDREDDWFLYDVAAAFLHNSVEGQKAVAHFFRKKA